MVTIKSKPIVDTLKNKEKGIKAYHYEKSSNYKEREDERNKGTTKEPENN